MSNDRFKPDRLYIITKDDQVRGYVHPTRMVLLQILAKEKRTISSVAREFGVHPANITHHFKLLEKTRLIRLVEKRDTGKNIEKYYRAIAYTFVINPNNIIGTNKKALALSILKNDLSVAINTVQKENDSKKVIAILGTAKISTGKVQQFINKLKNLAEDFKACNSSDGSVYNINLSLYPNDLDYLVKNNKNVEIV